jgi:hypothetical protein
MNAQKSNVNHAYFGPIGSVFFRLSQKGNISIRSKSRFYTSLWIFILNFSCGGKAQFHGGSSLEKKLPPEEKTSLDQREEAPTQPLPVLSSQEAPAAPQLVEWFWSCDQEPVQETSSGRTSSEGAVQLSDQGEHAINFDPKTPTDFKFSGKVCPPSELDRDLVFVVDVSGSMVDNDPRIIDSCARLEALQGLLQSLTLPKPGGSGVSNVRFGVATFSSSLLTYSTGLYSNAQKFFTDLSKGGPPADVLCLADGGTNYDSGITKAAELLQGGRVGATKEIYLISDGQPTQGQEGIALATQLKDLGVTVAGSGSPIKVTIATMMLKGVDTVLESKVASKDPNGKPLHSFVQNAQDLGKVLGSLAESQMTKATIRVEQEASGQVVKTDLLDLMPYIKQLEFNMPPLTVNWANPTAKLKVDVIYTDSHGRVQEKHGQITKKQ